jgi:hypothetical protein
MEQRKNKNKKYIVAFGGLRLMILFNATTNQKQVAATDGTTEGMCNKQEVRGKLDTIVFGGGKAKERERGGNVAHPQ